MDHGKAKGFKPKGRDRATGFAGTGIEDSSPGKLLTMRLEKLEKDLQLLTGIQTLLMTGDHQNQNGFNFSRFSSTMNPTSDIPERDSDHNNNSHQSHTVSNSGIGSRLSCNTGNKNCINCNKNSKVSWNSKTSLRHSEPITQNQNQDGREVVNSPSSGFVSGSGSGLCLSSASGVKTKKKTSNNTNALQSVGNKATELNTLIDQAQIQVECQSAEVEGNLELLEALNSERKIRLDIEDSAKVVAIKLQQSEDELGRERETKQMLLVGTLQLKNQISSQESHIKDCEANIKELKTETTKLREAMEKASAEKMAIAKKCKDVIFALRADKKLLECQIKKFSLEKADIESQLEEKRKDCVQKEQSLHTQDQKNVTKYNQIVAKCAQLDKERQDLALELRGTLEKLQITDSELTSTRDTLRKIETESERETILKDCILKKLKCDMMQQQQQFESQIQNSQSILSKTKSLIIQVKKERDDLRQSIKTCQEENQISKRQTQEAIQKHQCVSKDLTNFKNNMVKVQKLSDSRIEKLTKENCSLKSLVKTLQKEKDLQKKLSLAAENDFLKEKSTCDEKIQTLTQEKEHATSELGRCMDNFRVLQKVSEDQTRTIQTLRGEREDQRKIKFSLETEIRERDANESTLTRKLEQEQRKRERLETTLQEYENKLSALEEELRDHNCEDFVENDMKRKLAKIEAEVKCKYEEWQESIEDARVQRDKALRDASVKQKEAEESKTECESRIFDITIAAKQEYQRLKVESKRILTEKSTRIMELEGELEQQKLQSTQMQRSLCGKIQQLQCALNVCITSNTSSTFGNMGVGPHPFSNFL